MEVVQHAMQQRCQHKHSARDEHQARIQGEDAGKELASGRVERADRTHAAQQHGRVEKSIHRGHLFGRHVADHADAKRNHHESNRHGHMRRNASIEGRTSEQRLVFGFVHGELMGVVVVA